jgi:hypothetical protein
VAQYLYFSRDTQFFVQIGASVWEIPIMDGFSFSQATDGAEITLNEASDASGNSRRGKKFFNKALSPAEWSFTTYMRPFKSVGGVTAGRADDTANAHHGVEDPLWALACGQATFTADSPTPFPGFTTDTTDLDIDFLSSNKTTLGTANFYFTLGACTGSNQTFYKITGACVNQVSIDFDINGIAQINWSGYGSTLTEEASAPARTIYEAIASTSNFIRNKVTSLTITGVSPYATSYQATLTGGNITINNNISYLTPENLCVVNTPLGHITGTRSIDGNFTSYLLYDTLATDKTQDLVEALLENTSLTTNDFVLNFKIGGASGLPRVEINIPNAHLEAPQHDISDVISADFAFHALPTSFDVADEISIKYVGA